MAVDLACQLHTQLLLGCAIGWHAAACADARERQAYSGKPVPGTLD